jgi:mono/diheme cytochrome c family protein
MVPTFRPSRKAMLETLCKHLKMVRVSAFAAVALTACVGNVSGVGGGGGDDTVTTDGGNPSDLKQAALDAWTNKAYPLFKLRCASCHADSNQTTQPAFLVGADANAVHTTIMGFNPQVIDVRAGASSRVYVKGSHLGPAWMPTEAPDILTWINAEVAAAAADTTTGMTTDIVTALITPTMCTVASGADDSSCAKTTVDLGAVGLTGSTITFVAQALSSTQGLYLDYLQVNGMGAGAYLEHPLFISYPQTGDMTPVPDDIDRFYDQKVDVAPSMSMPIGPGEAAFLTFDPTAPIKISFKVVTPYVPPTTTTTAGGCKSVAVFTSSKTQSELNTRCAGCHTGTSNANAKSAMDLTGIGSTDPTMLATACAQALSHINTVQAASSALLVEPDPAQAAGHPYKITPAATLTTYQNEIKTWITAEQGASP